MYTRTFNSTAHSVSFFFFFLHSWNGIFFSSSSPYPLIFIWNDDAPLFFQASLLVRTLYSHKAKNPYEHTLSSNYGACVRLLAMRSLIRDILFRYFARCACISMYLSFMCACGSVRLFRYIIEFNCVHCTRCSAFTSRLSMRINNDRIHYVRSLLHGLHAFGSPGRMRLAWVLPQFCSLAKIALWVALCSAVFLSHQTMSNRVSHCPSEQKNHVFAQHTIITFVNWWN